MLDQVLLKEVAKDWASRIVKLCEAMGFDVSANDKKFFQREDVLVLIKDLEGFLTQSEDAVLYRQQRRYAYCEISRIMHGREETGSNWQKGLPVPASDLEKTTLCSGCMLARLKISTDLFEKGPLHKLKEIIAKFLRAHEYDCLEALYRESTWFEHDEWACMANHFNVTSEYIAACRAPLLAEIKRQENLPRDPATLFT